MHMQCVPDSLLLFLNNGRKLRDRRVPTDAEGEIKIGIRIRNCLTENKTNSTLHLSPQTKKQLTECLPVSLRLPDTRYSNVRPPRVVKSLAWLYLRAKLGRSRKVEGPARARWCEQDTVFTAFGSLLKLAAECSVFRVQAPQKGVSGELVTRYDVVIAVIWCPLFEVCGMPVKAWQFDVPCLI